MLSLLFWFYKYEISQHQIIVGSRTLLLSSDQRLKLTFLVILRLYYVFNLLIILLKNATVWPQHSALTCFNCFMFHDEGAEFKRQETVKCLRKQEADLKGHIVKSCQFE